MTTIPVHVALIDDTATIPRAQLERVAGALNEQLQDDVVRHWTHVRATVGTGRGAAPGQWSIRIREQLDEPDALGYHTTDDHNQPVSYVELTEDWTITASHELLEMVVDPSGNMMHGARLPNGLEGHYREFGLPHESSHVLYLLEVCDPCEAAAYEVGEVNVSDFLLPGWYRTSPLAAPAYSHTGLCLRPRQVASGGYVSFATPAGDWFQAFNRGGHLSAQGIGRFDRGRFSSLREFSDTFAREYRAGA
jgi:hypothetical protein